MELLPARSQPRRVFASLNPVPKTCLTGKSVSAGVFTSGRFGAVGPISCDAATRVVRPSCMLWFSGFPIGMNDQGWLARPASIPSSPLCWEEHLRLKPPESVGLA